MKVLYVTNMYPNEKDPYYGIFVKEQIEAINRVSQIEDTIFVIDGKNGIQEYLKSIIKIRKLVKKEKFDIIHIHYGLSGLFLLFGSVNVPVLMTLHGGDIQIEQGKTFQVYLTKRILKHCNYAITLNEKMDDIVRKYINKTIIIPCSVNTSVFNVYPDKKEERNNSLNILFPSSRSRKVKDFPLFQKVCNVIRKKYHLKVDEYYLENLNRIDVAKLFNKMDVLLMTSISEGSPQVVKEAMACNLPVISTNVGDVSVLLSNVKDSYVSITRDENELASLVMLSLERKGKGIQPREKIMELKLDDDSIADKIISTYRKIIGNIQT